MNSITINVPVTISEMEMDVSASLSGMDLIIPVDLGQTIPAPVTYYDGEYTVTPGSETITLRTKEKYLAQNITVNPVPSNYGLITWDGSILTVS